MRIKSGNIIHCNGLWFFLMGVIVASCNVRPFIPADKTLYNGAEIVFDSVGKVENLKELRYMLEELEYPTPNTRFLGMKPGLYFHYKSQRDSGWISEFINRRIGEEPVYMEAVDVETMERLINNRLENRGHFNSKIRSSIETDEKSKTASVTYRLEIPGYYELNAYQLEGDSLPVHPKIKDYLDSTNIIEIGQPFDLNKMKMERESLDKYLKNKGFYNFNENFLQFEADTNQYNNKQFDLYLKLKPDAPAKAMIPYRIRQVNVYPNYTIQMDSARADTLHYHDKYFIQDDLYFHPEKLDPLIEIQKGDYYSANRSSGTSRRLGATGVYKFVNIRYDEVSQEGQDTIGGLIANIFLSPLKQRTIRTEVQAVTKSNNFTGPSLALVYSNRNLFNGGENLDITANAGYETQLHRNNEPGRNSVQLSLESSLVFPRIMLPFTINTNWFRYSIPKTRVGLGGEYVSRTRLFSMSSVSAVYGFYWNANRFITHEFYPVSITYLNLLKSTPEFELILDQNPFLQSSFDQQFISGLTYSYTYNGMVDQQKKHQFFLNSNIDIAGNLISLLTKSRQVEPNTFLGLQYAQYAKMVMDVRYHLNLGRRQKLATRLLAGIGKPYGNSDVLPYSKQFYSGGPYSVRAFDTRQLGPGSYNPDNFPGERRSYFDQTGNIRLEANMEYRFPLVSYLFGAVFIDAGNVWLSDFNAELPGGQIQSDFLSELGLGAGVGLRLDVQSFVIRADLGAPIRDPGQPQGERWVWRFDRPIVNLAIGYPF